LGIGNHVDHLEVFLAALAIRLTNVEGDRIWFYEDPYAMLPGVRRGHFLTRHLPGSKTVPRPGFRARLLDWLLCLRKGGPSLESLLPPGTLSLSWEVTPVRIAAHEQRKLMAVRAYASQLSAFGGTSWLRELHRQHALFEHAELFWQVAAPTWNSAAKRSPEA
jgi:hypothetical protein